MKTSATVLALLLSVDAIHMPLKGSALIQAKYDPNAGSCGIPGYPSCVSLYGYGPRDDLQLKDAVANKMPLKGSALIQTK